MICKNYEERLNKEVKFALKIHLKSTPKQFLGLGLEQQVEVSSLQNKVTGNKKKPRESMQQRQIMRKKCDSDVKRPCSLRPCFPGIPEYMYMSLTLTMPLNLVLCSYYIYLFAGMESINLLFFISLFLFCFWFLFQFVSICDSDYEERQQKKMQRISSDLFVCLFLCFFLCHLNNVFIILYLLISYLCVIFFSLILIILSANFILQIIGKNTSCSLCVLMFCFFLFFPSVFLTISANYYH